MVAVMQTWRPRREQGAQTLLALDQWTPAQILPVEVEEIEQEEDQRRRVGAVRSELDDVERRGDRLPITGIFLIQ